MRNKNYKPHLKVVSKKLINTRDPFDRPLHRRFEQSTDLDHIELAFTNIGKAVSKLSRKLGSEGSEIKPEKIFLWDKDQLHLIDVENIEYCRGYGDYTEFHLKNRFPILFSDSIGRAWQMLDERVFIKPHKSWIININEAASLKFNVRELVTKSGVISPISKPNIARLKRLYS